VTATDEQVRKALDEGLSERAVAERLGVPRNQVRAAKARLADQPPTIEPPTQPLPQPVGELTTTQPTALIAEPAQWSPVGEKLATQWSAVAAQPTRSVDQPAVPATQPANGQEPGAHLVAWTGFIFGSLMSIAANVLHAWLPASHSAPDWSPGIAPQVGAAVWPIGLLLSVEALSRVRWPKGLLWILARYVGAGSVAVATAIISYGHVHDVLVSWGYSDVGATVGPIVLDGLMVVSGFALLAMSSRPAGDRS
jgi:hypothetical protein